MRNLHAAMYYLSKDYNSTAASSPAMIKPHKILLEKPTDK